MPTNVSPAKPCARPSPTKVEIRSGEVPMRMPFCVWPRLAVMLKSAVIITWNYQERTKDVAC